MILGDIINNKILFNKLKGIDFPANRLYNNYKAIKEIDSEIINWEELKNDYIRKHGEETSSEKIELVKDNDKIEFLNWAEGVLKTEVVVEGLNIRTEDFTTINLSIKELEFLNKYNLIEDNNEI